MLQLAGFQVLAAEKPGAQEEVEKAEEKEADQFGKNDTQLIVQFTMACLRFTIWDLKKTERTKIVKPKYWP